MLQSIAQNQVAGRLKYLSSYTFPPRGYFFLQTRNLKQVSVSLMIASGTSMAAWTATRRKRNKYPNNLRLRKPINCLPPRAGQVYWKISLWFCLIMFFPSYWPLLETECCPRLMFVWIWDILKCVCCAPARWSTHRLRGGKSSNPLAFSFGMRNTLWSLHSPRSCILPPKFCYNSLFLNVIFNKNQHKYT